MKDRVLIGTAIAETGERFKEPFTIEQAKQWLIDYGVPNAEKLTTEEEIAKSFFEYYN